MLKQIWKYIKVLKNIHDLPKCHAEVSFQMKKERGNEQKNFLKIYWDFTSCNFSPIFYSSILWYLQIESFYKLQLSSNILFLPT